ncbi:hypothetical protein BRARA_F01121 [Brassica rapa]|uniref:TIR domain-containing protein n=1 Tax=Brassica campestris TaxID=3711 RepID=A0A397YWD7_BRACM|nr:hypothetical protein BRARA_F01121 [Brassica rapa]
MDLKVLTPQHQVFINFRGDELRNYFISHLVDALQRNEINVFTDKKEKKGEDISNLFKRIEESKIAVAVFSKRYTESRWCLDELVKMKERADLGKLKVFPIFYNVTTHEVKLLEGDFGTHFRRLEWDYRSEQRRVDKWKEALACVSATSGSLSESDFTKSTVKEILILLQTIPSVQAENCLVKKLFLFGYNLLVKRLPVIGETSAMKMDSFISSEAQKGSIDSPSESKIKSFSGNNSLAPHEAIASGQGPTPKETSRITFKPRGDIPQTATDFDNKMSKVQMFEQKFASRMTRNLDSQPRGDIPQTATDFDNKMSKVQMFEQKFASRMTRNLDSPPEAKIKSFTGSSSLAPHETIASGQVTTPTETSRITFKPRGDIP